MHARAYELIQRIAIINEKDKACEHEGFKVNANIGGWYRSLLIEGLLSIFVRKEGTIFILAASGLRRI